LKYSSKSKRDISTYDFQQYSKVNLNTDTLADFKANSTWILPQLMALLGTKLQLIRTSDGLVSFSKTLTSLGSGEITFDSGLPLARPDLQGILRVLTHTHRSQFVHGRLTAEFGARYNGLVPLIPSAVKQYRGVGYSEWDWADAKRAYFLDPDFDNIADLIGTFDNPFSKEELLEIRGDSDPKLYKSVSVLSRVDNLDFKTLPVLARLMLAQMWIAHPTLRHPLAITNLYQPDIPAEPLVVLEVLDPWASDSAWGVSLPNSKRKETTDIPWDV